MKCINCKIENSLVEQTDTDKNFFEYQFRGDRFVVNKKNTKNNFFCFNCNTEFKARAEGTKIKDVLMVPVDFSEWTIIFDKEIKGGAWFTIFKDKGTSYFCKVWGAELTKKIKEQDFYDGQIWDAELRAEFNQKEGQKGSVFYSLNFNKNTVNEREE